jgi:DNA-binding response OmpR family regulator
VTSPYGLTRGDSAWIEYLLLALPASLFATENYKFQPIFNPQTRHTPDDVSSRFFQFRAESFLLNNSILVIDDEPRDIHLLSEMLLSEGYQVFAALNGKQGFQRALEHLPAAILLDLYMPELDGIGTAKLMKTDPRLAAIPVLFLTGSGVLDDKLLAFNAGAVDYITKPFSAQEVIARLRVHTRREIASSTVAAQPSVAVPASVVDEPSSLRLVRKAQALIGDGLACTLNLTELAHAVGTNERRLTAEFRRYTGGAVFEYQRKLRHQKACELLLHSDTAVGLIGQRVGFSTAAAFTYAFRQHCGMTPSEYRASAGIAPQGIRP